MFSGFAARVCSRRRFVHALRATFLFVWVVAASAIARADVAQNGILSAGRIQVLALDSATQRAVIRLEGQMPKVVSSGESLPEAGARVKKILGDRIEFETVGRDGRRGRAWLVREVNGTSRVIELEMKPPPIAVGVAPAAAVSGRK